ncbi:MAG: ammonium transporter [Bacillota bacterium]
MIDIAELSKYLNIAWVLITAVLVFFMQAGFAMVETGFTRAKNAGNIIMKNLMDFALGTIVFYLIGFAIMFGTDAGGVIGTTGFFNPTAMQLGAFESLDPGSFIIFQTVFAATAATIVSGAMAERTKFSSYLIYSVVISLVIYPVVGHWVWGGGWLSQMGFVDFAGSTVVHSVGGWAALVGAAVLGPRIGKYGPDGKVNAIPGHNIPIGALGVFILWFGWFGFNCGSELAADGVIGHVAMTTNLAAAAGATVAVFYTWIRYGKPDVSLTLNGALAGLVGITAGCAVSTLEGAIFIGAIAALCMLIAVEVLDRKIRIDDPVGAISVHGVSGAVGTLLVGVFANSGDIVGLAYGGGFSQLGVQAVGVLAVAAWTLATGAVLFFGIKKTVGLRVKPEDEITGLDQSEHGMASYPDFLIK